MIGDAISRKDAIEWVQNILTVDRYYHPHSKSRNVPIDEVIDSLERVPSINKIKSGRWTHEDRYSATYKYRCSECGAHHRARYDYCPSCGARMDAERKEK